ncbi:piggyBac transposable element-derived protein 3-like [Palaemon carinicauda]|uniref:piggyBac transposable element-derived protein 3-like n=1 Tax=Palaemon carinicauda TaxID=392227 RepID=UPI0035B68131
MNEIYDLLDNLENKEADVSVNPPLEDPDLDIDQDSDASEDEVTCSPDHLPRRIFPIDLAIDIAGHSTIYAEQKSLSKDHITPENMKIFRSILILSGYNKLPYRRMYWSETPDVFNNLVSESFWKDTFDKILRSLHFDDNMKMTDNRFYKVRPLFQHLGNVSNLQFQQEFHNIDEIMIPEYGKHWAKQFIRGKPLYVISGMKIFCSFKCLVAARAAIK